MESGGEKLRITTEDLQTTSPVPLPTSSSSTGPSCFFRSQGEVKTHIEKEADGNATRFRLRPTPTHLLYLPVRFSLLLFVTPL